MLAVFVIVSLAAALFHNRILSTRTR
jgi:hypothetical protein